jgi:hypothetical protein
VPFSLGHSKLGFAQQRHAGIPSMDAQRNVHLHPIVQAASLCRGCEWVFMLWLWLFNVPERRCLSRDEVPLDCCSHRRIFETGLMLGQLHQQETPPTSRVQGGSSLEGVVVVPQFSHKFFSSPGFDGPHTMSSMRRCCEKTLVVVCAHESAEVTSRLQKASLF